MSPDEMMTPDEAFEAYRPLVEDNDQAIPILVYATEEAVQPIGLTGTPPGSMQEFVGLVLSQMRMTLGPPVWIALSVEAHTKAMSREEMDRHVPGDLAEEAKAKPDAVGECVSMVGVSRDTAWSRIVSFVRTENGITWDEVYDVPPLGGIPDIMIEAVRG